MTELKQAFVTPDGKFFETKAEAQNYLRRPKIAEALNELNGNNEELTTWLIDNQEQVEISFETGTIRRVTKSEAKKVADGFEALAGIEGLPKAVHFLIDNAEAFKDSFRWPSVKRMSDEEKTEEALKSLTIIAEGNEKLANWIIANKDALLAAYQAGVVKREVSPKALEGLAAYQAKKKAEKEAAEASNKA